MNDDRLRPDGSFVREAIDRADALRRAGKFDAAAEALLGALAKGAAAAEIHYHLGNVRVDAGDLAAAEASYRMALSLDPNHVNATHNLAVVCKRQGRVAEFVRTYKRARRLADRRVRSNGASTVGRRRPRARSIGIAIGIAVLVFVAWMLTR